MNAVRARWSSDSFLVYAGGYVVLVAAVWALVVLARDYGSGGLAGWAALVAAVLLAIAVSLRRASRPVAAGVFAFVAVVAFAVFVGALERWWGWLSTPSSAFEGVHGGLILLELVTLAAALAALRVFRFPLIVSITAAVAWYFVTALLSNGGNWSAIVTFAVGLCFLVLALRLDRTPGRAYGFWLHVAAGMTIGGSLLFFWHRTDLHWSLVALAGVLYVGYAWVLDRSSWAVLGTIGLLLSAEHFASKWGSGPIPLPVVGTDLFGEGGHAWAGPVVYAVLGFLLVALALVLDRFRRPASAP